MVWVVDEKEGKMLSLPARLLEPKQVKVALSPMAWKILQVLTDKPSYPKEIGKKLKVHEQKVYYHIRNLEKAKLVEVVREERRQGAITKFYSIKDPALALTLKPLEFSPKLLPTKQGCKEFLYPFIDDGKMNAIIVVGHHEHHRPTQEMAHDEIHATNLALFLGTFLSHIPQESMKYDTELRDDDLKNNLIVIGGPGVNYVTKRINKKLPIRFENVKYKGNYYVSFYSDVSKKRYSDEKYGIIVKIKNPFDKTKQILLVAGIRFWGTKAAVLAFLQKFNEICSGNSYDKRIYAKVVNSLDLDNDGVIDSVEFVE